MTYQPPFTITRRLLGEADASSDCTAFIGFLLQALYDSLQEAIASQPATNETRVKTRVKTPDRILNLLQAQPDLTLAEVAAAINLSVSAVERAAAKLKKEGKLIFIGPKKGGHWTVRNGQ